MSTARFRPADRVLLARDYARARRHGRRLASKNFALSVAPRDDRLIRDRHARGGHESKTRLGMAVSRKVGNAVVRNRVKRAIREWFRHSRELVAAETDLVVVARRGARDLDTGQIAEELSGLLSGSRQHGKRRVAGNR